jgi:adenylosuccinate synthase
LILTKLDVLTGFETIKIGVDYKQTQPRPSSSPFLPQLISPLAFPPEEVVYEEVSGWKEDITGVRRFEELPKTAQQYIQRVETLVGCPVAGFSVGPDREQTIIRDAELRSFSNHDPLK